VDRATLLAMLDKACAAGMDTRGIVDHAMFDSLYLRDPNGYVVELACPRDAQRLGMDPAVNGARQMLDRWTASKAAGAAG
jgi:catechol-2,3-dioxygenase